MILQLIVKYDKRGVRKSQKGKWMVKGEELGRKGVNYIEVNYCKPINVNT
jgi:hypothetical protein